MTMKKVFALCLLFLLFISSITLETKALTFDKLPTKQTSNQLKVDNIGKDLSTVEIYMYRNEPNSTTKYALFGCPDENADCKQNHYD